MKTLDIGQLARAKILVRAPNWIGDAVMCLPALRELRRVLPEAELVLVARPWVLDVFPTAELRCRTIAYDTRGRQAGLGGRWRFATLLRKEKFSAAILFQNALDAAVLATLSGIPIRAGYARQGRGPLLTHAAAVPRPGEIPPHEANYYLELLRRLGLISHLPEVEQILLPMPESARAAARAQLEKLFSEQVSSSAARPMANSANGKLLVGIGAGASFGTAKRWPADRFAELALRLNRELGAASIFFGSREERPLVESLLPKAGDASISLAGKTSLEEFIRLVPGCDLYVTNDTGTMHVASALGVPTLAIFGPTDERGTRPLGPRAQVITGTAFCRPCKLRHCPIDHRCMTSISVEEVFQAARRSLSGLAPAPAATVRPKSQRRILIVRLGSMGDIIHSLPVVAALKESFPDWEIDWLVESRWRDLPQGNPPLSRIVECDTLEWRKHPLSPGAWASFRATIGALKERRYDSALDLQGSLKSAVASTLAGAREVIGFEKPWLREPACATLYTRRVPTSAVHIVNANLALARALGADIASIRFPLPEGDPASLPPGLPQGGFAVLNPGAGWQSKCWSPGGYALLSDALQRDFSLQVVLNVGPGEEALARQVQNACRIANPQLYFGNLKGLIALLRRSRLMVGPDTGPLHLAAALGVPTVGLFGPTDPERNGPYGRRHKSLRPDNATTSYRHSATNGSAMSQIRPEEVIETIRELLREENGGATRNRTI